MATEGPYCWLVVKVLTWSSGPNGVPVGSNRRAKMPRLSPSWPKLCQDTTKPPAPSTATEALRWKEVVKVLTANSGPTGVASGAKRCAKTPRSEPSWYRLCQATTKAPAAFIATAGAACVPVVYVFPTNSAPRRSEGSNRPRMPPESPSWRRWSDYDEPAVVGGTSPYWRPWRTTTWTGTRASRRTRGEYP